MTRRRPKAAKQTPSYTSRLALLEDEVQDLREQLALERIHFEAALDTVVKTRLELEVSRERYVDLYDTAPVGYILLDRDGFIHEANLTAARMFGMPRERLPGSLLSRFVRKEHHRTLLQHFNRCSRSSGDEEVTSELTVIGEEGRLMDIVLMSRTMSRPEKSHAKANFRTALVDITARKKAERQSQESEERFRTMAQAVPSFLFETDAAGWNIWTSEGWCRFTGQTPEQVAGHGWAEALHPHDRASNIDRWMQCMKDSVPFESQQRLRRSDGTYVWVIARALPVRDRRGTVTRWVGSVTNVDDIVRGQEALRESEERFAKAFRTSPHPIGITEVETGRCIEVNQACLQLFGFCREEVIGNTTLMLGIWPNPEDRVQLVGRLKAGEPVRNMESTFRTKSGDLRHILVSSDLAELNGTLCLITIGNDITDRKRAEEAVHELNRGLEQRVRERTAALVEANERWDWVVRATNDAIWDWDLVHDTIYFSPRWKTMHGFEEDDATESKEEWYTRIHPEDRTSVLTSLEAYLHGEQDTFSEEYRIRRKDGTYLWVLDRGIAIFNEQGRAVRMVGAETDITWRKGIEQALRFREQQFHTLADNVPGLFAYVDRARRYRFVNNEYEQLFGRSDEEIANMSVRDLLGPESYAEVQSQLDKALSGTPVSFEYERKRQDGSRHFLSARYVPDRNDQAEVIGVFALHTDITVLKSTEALLREREAQLRQLGARLLQAQEEERRRISRDLHDDVMQRLGALTMELYGLASSSSSDMELLSQIKACGASAEQLTTDLQRMAHHLHPSVLEFGGFEIAVREQVHEFGVRTGLSAEVIIQDLPRDIPLDHATCLYRVLQEGLQNVQKHAKATTVLVRLLRTGEGVGLCIHDDGGGIKNSDGIVRRRGLGLTSMAERVGMLNGTFRIKTKPNEGTELHAWVPLKDEGPGT